MAVLQPPPTFTLPIVVDEETGKASFSPVWLRWFLDFAQVINDAGGTTLSISLGAASPVLATGGSVDSGGDGEGFIVPGPHGLQGLPGASTFLFGEDGLEGEQGLPGLPGLGTSAWSGWVPTRTGWTDVGSPTVTARYSLVGSYFCLFQVKIVPSTSVATTAGTSYISLPVSAGASGIGGDGSMSDTTTLIAIGSCVFDVANSRCYVPTQIATGDTLVINGWYEV